MPAIPLSLCLRMNEVTDPLVRPGGQWVSGVMTEWVDGVARNVLRMWSVETGRGVELLADPVPSAGRAPSGGVHEWSHEGDTAWVVTKDAGIVAVRIDGDAVVGVERTSFDAGRSWSTPSMSADGARLWAVADWHGVWCMNMANGAAERRFDAGDGYVLDVDGRGEARWHTWERPDMAWTRSRVYPAPYADGVAVQQPRATRDGRTRGLVTDAGGVMNVLVEPDQWCGEPTLVRDACEHGGPTWGPGQRTWCPSPDGSRVAYTRNEDGFGSLWVWDRRSDERRQLGRGVHGCVSWEGDTIAACRSGARTPPQVVVYDMSRGGERRVLVNPSDGAWSSPEVDVHLVEPSVHRAVAVDGVRIPYRLYRAAERHGGLICWVHGGPIDQWQVTFRPRFSYWLSRGWSIVVPDHRGTTGHGRAFAAALEGAWGDLDARDTAAVMHDVQRVHGFAAEHTVVMGSSAGGLTALNVVGDGAQVAGVVLCYPVVDLADTMEGDDPFETHYMPRLIGAASATDEVLAQRSPLARADVLARVPILVFHGDADQVVPLSHSLRLRDAVGAAGGDIEVCVMAGEGHGFRDPANVGLEYEQTERFLGRRLAGNR